MNGTVAPSARRRAVASTARSGKPVSAAILASMSLLEDSVGAFKSLDELGVVMTGAVD